MTAPRGPCALGGRPSRSRADPPSQVRIVGLAMMRLVQQKLAWLAHHADLDEDGELTLDDGQQAYSRVAPIVRKHTALSCGAVGGFFAAYSGLR